MTKEDLQNHTQALVNDGRLPEAIARLTTLVSSEESDVIKAESLLLRGQILYAMGRSKEAFEDLRQAIRLNPELGERISGHFTNNNH